MSDMALAVSKANRSTLPTPQAALKVSAKVKRAIELMVWEGKPYNDAAQEAGLTTRSMRLALAKPHVVQYLNAGRQVLRTSAGPRNIQRLLEIRDADNNQPAVNAIKLLEQIGDEPGLSTQQQRAPGVVIVVNGSPTAATVTAIDGKMIEHDPQ